MARLEALAVHDGWTALIVFLLGDPHLLEGRERGKDGTTDPDGVLSLGRSNDLDLHGRGSKSSDFLLHAVGDTWVHSGTTRLEKKSVEAQLINFVVTYHDNVAIKILTDIDITFHDGVESGNVNAARLKTKDRWLEEGLRSSESLVTDGDDLAVGKFVRLLEGRALRSGLDFLLKVERDVAKLLFDVSNNFALGSGRESVASLSQDSHEVVRQVATSHVDTGDSVGKCKTFVDGDNVSDTITRVEHDTSCATRGVQGEHGLDGDVEGGGVECLENDLGHLLSVRLGVDGGFSEKDWVLLGGDTEFVVEGVMPNLLHIVPVGDDTVLDGISESEDTLASTGLHHRRRSPSGPYRS